MDLFVVEAPGKVKQFANLLDQLRFKKGSYEIFATRGRMFDLPENSLGITESMEPIFEIKPGYESSLKSLIFLAKNARQIFCFTDPDDQGELIAYQTLLALRKNGVKTEFSVCNTTTLDKEGVGAAMASPRSIDFQKTSSALKKRIVDRLLTYSHSDITLEGNAGIVGRCKSYALHCFSTDNNPYASLSFSNDEFNLSLVLSDHEYLSLKKIDSKILERIINQASPERFGDFEEVESPPLTGTDAILALSETYEDDVVSIYESLQGCYEKGCISYIRTDSRWLSKSAIDKTRAATTSFISSLPQDWRQKSFNFDNKGAHESIHLLPNDTKVLSDKEKRVMMALSGLVVRSASNPRRRYFSIIEKEIGGAKYCLKYIKKDDLTPWATDTLKGVRACSWDQKMLHVMQKENISTEAQRVYLLDRNRGYIDASHRSLNELGEQHLEYIQKNCDFVVTKDFQNEVLGLFESSNPMTKKALQNIGVINSSKINNQFIKEVTHENSIKMDLN